MNIVNNSRDSKYNMIIGSNILHNLQIDLLFSKGRIGCRNPNNPFNYNSIPMKELGTMSDPDLCDMVYDFHRTIPMLQ